MVVRMAHIQHVAFRSTTARRQPGGRVRASLVGKFSATSCLCWGVTLLLVLMLGVALVRFGASQTSSRSVVPSWTEPTGQQIAVHQ
jgi:hypothetical protein